MESYRCGLAPPDNRTNNSLIMCELLVSSVNKPELAVFLERIPNLLPAHLFS